MPPPPPDADVQINPGAPPGSPNEMLAFIDSDNNSTGELFIIENNGGGSTHRQMTVNEDGDWQTYGPIRFSSTFLLNCYYAAYSPVIFYLSGVAMAEITFAGLGDFSNGGVNLPILGGNPNGVKSGTLGDLVSWYDSGASKWRLMVCAGSTTWSFA